MPRLIIYTVDVSTTALTSGPVKLPPVEVLFWGRVATQWIP
jgi:hypothetical protein